MSKYFLMSIAVAISLLFAIGGVSQVMAEDTSTQTVSTTDNTNTTDTSTTDGTTQTPTDTQQNSYPSTDNSQTNDSAGSTQNDGSQDTTTQTDPTQSDTNQTIDVPPVDSSTPPTDSIPGPIDIPVQNQPPSQNNTTPAPSHSNASSNNEHVVRQHKSNIDNKVNAVPSKSVQSTINSLAYLFGLDKGEYQMQHTYGYETLDPHLRIALLYFAIADCLIGLLAMFSKEKSSRFGFRNAL